MNTASVPFKTYLKIAGAGCAAVIIFSSVAMLQTKPKYVGSDKCKLCHSLPSRGNQYKAWVNMLCAKAYVNLATPQAKEIAVKAGITGDPQQAEECLKCHQTAFGLDPSLVDKSFKSGTGIGCETCHGPGSLFTNPNVMTILKFQADSVATAKELQSLGMIYPDEKLCLQCHNKQSPTYKEFNYQEFCAKIAHYFPPNHLKQK